MRVLYVSKALRTAAYRDKLRALAVHVEPVAVVPAEWGGQPLEEGSDFPTVRPWPTRFHGHNHLHVYRRAARLLDEIRPDLVHIDEEPYSAVTFQLARLCRLRGIPAVFFAWQNLHKRLPPPFGALRSAVFRSVAGAIAGTDAAAAVLRGAGYARPLAVIPQFGVDASRFAPDPDARARLRARLGADPCELLVGAAARLVPEKGIDVLLRAVASQPGLRLVVLGDGPERAPLEEASRRAGAAGRVHFPGHVPSLEVAPWLAGLDVIVLPSLGRRNWVEQFGRVLVEAMACGVPAVGSDSGEIPRVIGDAGIVVPEGDAAALAAALRALAADPARRAELGRRARERVLARWTQERVAADTAAFYQTVLGRRMVAAGDGAR